MNVCRFKSILLVVVMLVAISISACSRITQDDDNETTPAPVAPDITLTMAQNLGSISAGEVHTVGLSASGTLFVAGKGTFGQLDAMFVPDIAQVVSRDNTIAALKTDGTVLLYGEHSDAFADALNWRNIVKLAIGESHIVGLTDNGRPVACGDNTNGACDVGDIRYISDIAAGAHHTVLLTADGNVIALGDPKDGKCSTLDWSGIAAIAATDTFTAALTFDGNVFLTGDNASIDWPHIVSLHSSGGYIYAHDQNAAFHIYPETAALAEFSDIEQVAFGQNHIAIMHSDGTVQCTGETDNKQCDTQLWDLRLTIMEDGYVTGFNPNTTVSDALQLLNFELDGSLAILKDSATQTEGLIGTGMSVTRNGEVVGDILIYGDIDGDGEITDADISLLEAHIDGSAPLDGIRLLAADALHYPGAELNLDERHVEALTNHISKQKSVSQYIYSPYYDKIARSYAINSDVVGWIYFQETDIDYPLLYGDNYYYHERNIYKEHYNGGCIYPLYHELFKVNAIAGHNMRGSGRMFHQLHDIQNNKEELLVYKNRVYGVQLYTGYVECEVFSIYETSANEPTSTLLYNIDRMFGFTKEDIQEWIDFQLSRSEIDLGVEVSTDDMFFVAYTCGDNYEYNRENQARLYVLMRKVSG